MFQEANFPKGIQQIDHHIVSSDQGFILMAVNHVNGISQLFTSDLEGSNYRLSLNNVRCFEKRRNNLSTDTVYTSDVHDVKGLTGCFIANQHLIDEATNESDTNKTKITWDRKAVKNKPVLSITEFLI